MGLVFVLESEAARLQTTPPSLIAPPAPRGTRRTSGAATAPLSLDVSFMTYNVLSLLDRGANCSDARPGADPAVRGEASCARFGCGLRVMGKRDLLKSQLADLRVHIAGLQETRLPQQALLPDRDFWMFHSASSDKGHFGMGLWVSKTLAFATFRGQKQYFMREHFTLIGASPRHLTFHVATACLRLQLVVAHAPHGACGSDSAEAFWQRVLGPVDMGAAADPLIILMDGNSRFGSVNSEAIGTWWAQEENAPAMALHPWLLRAGLFLPSTFDSHHSGVDATWISPQGTSHRLDYVAFPLEWFSCSSSTTVTDMELLQAREDHRPVIARCCFAGPDLSTKPVVIRKRSAIRPDERTDPWQLKVFTHVIQSHPGLPWGLDVDDHCEAWTDLWTSAWHDTVAPSPPAPQQVYLSDTTLSLVQSRKAYRRYVHQEEQELRRRRLMVAFAGFVHLLRGSSFDPRALALVAHWTWEMQISIARGAWALMHLGRDVRREVRADRCRYLRSVAGSVALCDPRRPKELYRAIRRAFPAARSNRQAAHSPLPCVALEDGTVATDYEARCRRWQSYFAEQEAGEPVDAQGYIDGFLSQRTLAQQIGPVFDLDCVPTLMEIEQSLLALPRRKAAGADSLTAEILQVCVPATARSLAPLYLKASLAVREPVSYRGGELICLAKKASEVFACSSFRSVLIANLPGKVMHRLLRAKLLPHFRKVAQPAQAGMCPGVSTDSLVLLAQTFCGVARSGGLLPSLLFFDLQAAYYRTVRQVIVPFGEDDTIGFDGCYTLWACLRRPWLN